MGNGKKLIGLAVCAAACLAAAGVGGAFMRASSPAWYDRLAKPAWRPPDWVFGPVWTVLYASMAVSAWLVWVGGRPGGAKTLALVLFAVQLALNAAWTGVFFWLQSPGAAFAEIVALWLAVAATVAAFWRLRPAAGALLLPYWGWVSFAAGLNLALWRMNR